MRGNIMGNEQINAESFGSLSQAEAELAGAFGEDALSLDDALASVGDDALSDSEIQAAIELAEQLQG
jgi:hypothetical protein